MSWQGFCGFRPRVRFAVRGVFAEPRSSHGGRAGPGKSAARRWRELFSHALSPEGRPIMTRHKFAIGQAVDFARRLPSVSTPTGPYEIVSVVPTDEANSPSYRIKSQAEPFARAVRETDLVAISLAAPANKQPRLCGPTPCPDGRLGRCDPGDGPRVLHPLERPNQAPDLTCPKRRAPPAPRETTRAAAFPRPTASDEHKRGSATV